MTPLKPATAAVRDAEGDGAGASAEGEARGQDHVELRPVQDEGNRPVNTETVDSTARADEDDVANTTTIPPETTTAAAQAGSGSKT